MPVRTEEYSMHVKHTLPVRYSLYNRQQNRIMSRFHKKNSKKKKKKKQMKQNIYARESWKCRFEAERFGMEGKKAYLEEF